MKDITYLLMAKVGFALVIPREGVESAKDEEKRGKNRKICDPERGS